LTAEKEREVVLALIENADVVVENFLPGTLERAGIDPRVLLRSNPRLVWCSITGFGAASRRPGYDYVVQAESGWMSITGEPRGEPMKTGVALADILAGKDAAIAVVAALSGRDRGIAIERYIAVSLAGSARAALTNVAQNTLLSGKEAMRWGNAHANLVPYQLFHARDRAIVIAVGNDDQWRACVTALGLDAFGNDPRLATNAGRLSQRELVANAFARVIATRDAAEWMQVLDTARVPCGTVKTVLEAIHDAGDASPLIGMPSSVGGSVRFVPPRLDEHGELIRSRGWDAFQSLQS